MNVIGDWRYDTSTMDFMSTDDDTTTGGHDLPFTGVDVVPDPELMDDAVSGAASVRSDYLEVPANISGEIRHAWPPRSPAARRPASARRGRCSSGSARTAASSTAPRTSTTTRAVSPRSSTSPAGSATASSSPRRWRSWRASSASRPAWPSASWSRRPPGPTATSSRRTTCMPGRSCTSRVPAGCGSSPRPPPCRVTSPPTPSADLRSGGDQHALPERRPGPATCCPLAARAPTPALPTTRVRRSRG